jgi:uncharacterized membrane protein
MFLNHTVGRTSAAIAARIRVETGNAAGELLMGKILENLHLTLGLGLVLAIALIFGLHGDFAANGVLFGQTVLRWLHVFAGITWIGLLYYFNFVQIPTMPAIPAELKPAVSKHIAPKALFFFRWGAAFTVLFGLLLAGHLGYLVEALTLQPSFQLIGIGMWLALIMAFNVWFIIWPNQKKALGIVPAEDAAKAKAARVAMLTSRINTLLSIPMLYAMAAYQSWPV